MHPGMNRDKTMPKGGTQCVKLSIIFLLLNISSFVAPVSGFALRACRISYNEAICHKSQLSAVPRYIPSTVTGFDLSVNFISKIQASDFKNRTALKELDLKRNRIKQIETGAFADLISLKWLNLNSNKLRKLQGNLFDGLSNLAELRITSNHIQAVASTSFKPLTNLTFLDISNNKLRQLTSVHSLLRQLPNLRYLTITNIALTQFQSWEQTNSSLGLAALDLSQNPIAVFRFTADVFPNLTQLKIACSQRKMKWEVRGKSRVSTLDISGLQLAFSGMKTIIESFNSSLTILRMNAMNNIDSLPALINTSCAISTLTTLVLRSNKLSSINPDLFSLCSNVTELELSKNEIQHVHAEAFRSLQGLRILSLSGNKLNCVPAATRNLSTLVELNLSTNDIKTLECQDFANLMYLRELSLHQNSISALEECVFKDLIRLQVLKLQTNQISKLSKAFVKHLPNLRQLHLNGNKLTVIQNGEFKGLMSLKNLSLHENKIKTLQKGSFIGLKNLTELQLLSNDIEVKGLKNGCFSGLTNLKRLDMRQNHIRYDDSSALLYPPFAELSSLETLAIPAQHRRGKAHLPSNILQGLTNLLDFNTRNAQILSLHKDMFNYTPQLQTLDISSNDLVNLSPDLFAPIQNLKGLYISRTSLQSLDFLIDANLTKLEFLQARRNQYSVFSEEVMKSLPALLYVDLQGNSFTCDCNNAWFLQWAENNNQTQVFDAYNFRCNYPRLLKDMKLLDLDIRSCSVDIDFICFISTTCVILLFMVVSFTHHFLRWQLAYAYYLFLALLYDSKHKNKQAPELYDAFISYNTHDEPWVIEELLPKLEGDQGWRLCLHHRDFEPGKPIIENITDAIYGSRKTICVISHRYLESEWCSREIQMASFRLFDEMKDVLILVFLDEIPTYLLSPYYRIRKLLKKQTYLAWPQDGEHTELFWEKLRQALKTREDFGEDRFNLIMVDRP
ncbi:toll-like receptor 13 [Pempheris klunzingeri]|uniref:toll-like receptor 13 n=1 Tax=Pempheris klunzingeri TaxID=3127111 RepID=UPI00397FBF9C